MATYKVTIEFKTDQDEEDFHQNMLDCLDSCCFEHLEITNVENVSISAEEAIEQVKELKMSFSCMLPSYWNDKLNEILDSVD